MLIKGKALGDKNVAPNTVYSILKNRKVEFEEPQDRDANDVIIIHFDLVENQYGVLIREFRPGFVNKEAIKKADILMLVIDEEQKQYSSWVFDVKVTVGGEDVIFHLLEQLEDSYKHKNSISTYLDGYTEQAHIGFITREYQEDRIRKEIAAREAYIVETEQMLVNIHSATKIPIQKKLLVKKMELNVLKRFVEGKIEINNVMHPIEKYWSVKAEEKNICNMRVYI